MSASDEQAGDGGEQGRVRQLTLSVGDLHEVLAPRIAEVVQAPAEERDRIAN